MKPKKEYTPEEIKDYLWICWDKGGLFKLRISDLAEMFGRSPEQIEGLYKRHYSEMRIEKIMEYLQKDKLPEFKKLTNDEERENFIKETAEELGCNITTIKNILKG